MAFLISNPSNIGYISDFWGSNAKIIIHNHITLFITDSRYAKQAKILCDQKGMIFIEQNHTKNFWHDLCFEYGIHSISIDKNNITLEQKEYLIQSLGAIAIQETTDTIHQKRIIKTPAEIACIQKACAIADAALEQTIHHVHEGITEQDLAWIFEKTAREEYGASGLSFDTIVAFGAHSACPHHSPTKKPLEQNTPILIDCGVRYQHYCSDMTRCFWFGEQKTPEYKKWNNTYQKVLAAQQAGIEEMYPTNSIDAAEKKARAVLGSEEQFFTHSFGHGVGIDIHELPHVSAKNTEPFEVGMVITAEPGLYYDNDFGIRIEDLLLITDSGNTILSQSIK